MAITNTSKSKEFVAGSSPIILKGDYRPTKMASAPDPRAELNQMALNMFGKELRLLTEDEMELLRDEYEISKGRIEEADGGRAEYGLGSLVKSVKKAVSGVVKGVKDNPLLAAAALNFAPMLAGGSPFFGLGGLKGSIKTFGNPLNLLNLSGAKDGVGAAVDALKVGSAGAAITGLLAGMEQE